MLTLWNSSYLKSVSYQGIGCCTLSSTIYLRDMFVRDMSGLTCPSRTWVMLAQVRADVPTVVRAYLMGDTAALKEHCAPEMTERLTAIIAAQQAQVPPPPAAPQPPPRPRPPPAWTAVRLRPGAVCLSTSRAYLG